MKKKEKKIEKKNLGSVERPRVIFSESNRFIRVQAVDDLSNKTLIYLTTENKKDNNFSRKNSEYALLLAEEMASLLLKENYKKIVFDRNRKKYHGKVKVFCDTLRKMGIIF